MGCSACERRVHQIPPAPGKTPGAARWCAECGVYHAASDGEVWVERSRDWSSLGMYKVLRMFVVSQGKVWDATEVGEVRGSGFGFGFGMWGVLFVSWKGCACLQIVCIWGWPALGWECARCAACAASRWAARVLTAPPLSPPARPRALQCNGTLRLWARAGWPANTHYNFMAEATRGTAGQQGGGRAGPSRKKGSKGRRR
jgi:hypothetical protein